MGMKLSIDIYLFDEEVQRKRYNRLDTYLFDQQIRCREIGAGNCMHRRLDTSGYDRYSFFSAMCSEKYNRLLLYQRDS